MVIATITALDVAFASAVAGALAVAAAPLTSYLTTRAANRHARWEKSYDDRRDALLGILRTVEAQRRDTADLATAFEKGDETAYGNVTMPDADELVARGAAIGAFAPAAVRDAFDRYIEAFDPVAPVILSVTPDTAADKAETVRSILRDTKPALTALQNEIRGELRD